VNWASFGLGTAAGFAWLLAAITGGSAIGRLLKRRAGDQEVPGADQAIALTREDEVTWAKPPAPGSATPPAHPAPGPGEHLGHGRRLLTVRFYEDGAACIWDATGRHAATFGSAADLGWDEWLKGLTT
jgi:hypothetical protein